MRLPITPKTEYLWTYLFGLLCIWFGTVSGGRALLAHFDLAHSYVAHPIILTSFYLGACAITALLYRENLYRLWRRLRLGECVGYLLPFFVFLAAFLAWAAHYGPHPLASLHPEVQFLQVGLVYLFPKTGEILFQQILIVLMVMALATRVRSRLLLGGIFSLIFAFGHLSLALFLDLGFVVMFALAALGAGFIFPYLILTLRCGVIYAFMLHWLFYAGLITFFWLFV